MKSLLSLKNLLIALFFVGLFVIPGKVSALSGGQFNAGEIISDSLFYNGSTMSSSQVQSFLNSKVPDCDTNGTQPASEYGRPDLTHAQYAASRGWQSPPYTCIKNYSVSTPSKSADSYCGAYSGGTKSAARIIYDVGRACHISQKVLVVTLQKEQGLIADTWPLDSQYKKAMGYGCPDTSGCDSTYYGFFNQVYNAARQFNRYKQLPENYNALPGRTNNVRYNPNSACKTKRVFISNFATAGLYDYTPYTPNGAALNNLYGSGDSCSSYGNRNFWRYYNDWFGSTLRNDQPPKFLTGDFNGDGKADLAFRRISTGEIFIRYGDGSGSFGSETTFTWAGGSHFEPLVADFNGDGKADLALRRISTGQIYIRYGNGSGSFGTQVVYTWAGGDHFNALAGDFNADGKADLALRRISTGEIYIRYGDGSGSFSSQTVCNWAGGDHFELLTDDVNGNNRSDLILRRINTGEIYIQYNLGGGNFGSQKVFDWAGGDHFQTLAADFDGNGKADIALRRINTGEVYIVYGVGNGTFSSQTVYTWLVFY